ncbi:MAG: histidinol-phosphatase [Promethearchaeota archaeon]
MDHHIHTFRCRHAIGTSGDYVRSAIKKGMAIVGISDHFPMRYLPKTIPVDEYAMEREEFGDYINELKDLRERYKDEIEVCIGTEVDFYLPEISTIKEWLTPYLGDLDYIYGSVHVVDDWPVDDSRFLENYQRVGINNVWIKYFENLLDMVKSGMFDIVGHFDIPKKYKNLPTIDMTDRIEVILDEIKESGMVMELNTAGARKPINEFYPSKRILKMAFEKGVQVTLGSDAHDPDEVGYAFPEAINLLKEIGYDSIVSFKNHKKYPISI